MTAARGGRQVIPRPDGWRPGGPPPWVDIATGDRAFTIAALGSALDARGSGRYRESSRAASGRVSAVLAPLYEAETGEVHVVLTRRAAHMRLHRGEVSFPGGGHDETDPTYIATALREAEEETQLPPDDVSIIGELDRFVTGGSGALVHPYVGRLSRSPEGRLIANPDEVEKILFVPIAALFEDDAWREEIWTRDGRSMRITFFEIEGDTVWGATASMLRQLMTIALGIEDEETRT